MGASPTPTCLSALINPSKRLDFGIMDDTVSIKSGSPAGTTASNGIKRKRGNEVKYYAVRVGYQPGVYHTWADCLDQVKGFKKATCKLKCYL